MNSHACTYTPFSNQGLIGSLRLGSILLIGFSASSEAAVVALSDSLLFDQTRANTPGVHSTSSRVSIVADNFSVPHPALIESMKWWGFAESGSTFDFVVTFYANDAGRPGGILGSSRGTLSKTPDAPNVFGRPIEIYSFRLDQAFPVNAGQNYWLSIFNEAEDTSWLWTIANPVDRLSFTRYLPDGEWRQLTVPASTNDYSFQIYGQVIPEPGCSCLVPVAVAAGMFRRRRF